MPYAVKVTQETVEYVIDWMVQHRLNVSDFQDDLDYYTEEGIEFYAYMDYAYGEDNCTFTTMTSDDLLSYWYFPHGAATHFRIIDRKL